MRPRIQYTTMDMGPLWREANEFLDARIELHNRLVLPPACILLALMESHSGSPREKAANPPPSC